MSQKQRLTRAEIVRRRRAAQAHRLQRQQSPRRAEAARAIPPVTARGKAPGWSPRQDARRRYQISLSLPNARLRRPTISIPRPGWRLFSLFLLALLGSGLYAAWNAPQLRVFAAEVSGNQRISAAEINALLGLNGAPLFLLVPSQLEARLLAYVEISAAEVEVGLPNRVRVTVTERQPLIVWQQDGGYTWIDEHGVAFRPRGQAAGLIVVQALGAPPVQTSVEGSLGPRPYIAVEMVRALKTLAAHLPPGTPILYDPQQGLGWDDSRGWRVYFGRNAEDAALKVRVYQALVEALTGRGIRPVLIDVSYPNAPYYRLEP